MSWFAWRQFRVQALVVFGLLVAAAVFCLITGPHLWNVYDALKTCQAHNDCESLTNSVLNGYNKFFPFVQTFSVALPALLGIFWGAPLIARELETGTYRLAWTQGVTRARWVVTKLAVVGGASMLAAGLMSWLVTWWASPIDTLNASRFGTTVFDSAYITPIGYAAFAFALGVTAGVLWRRTVPAMATTLAVFVLVRVPFDHFVRPYLMTPVKQIVSLKHLGNFGFEQGPSGLNFVFGDVSRPNALVVGNTVVGNHGRSVTQQWLRTHCQALVHMGAPNPGKGIHKTIGARPAAFNQCIDRITASFHGVVSYQPASRFWAFQWYEMTIYIVAGVLLAAFSAWWVRRRVA